MAFSVLAKCSRAFSTYSSNAGFALNQLKTHLDSVDGLSRVCANVSGFSGALSVFKGYPEKAYTSFNVASAFGTVEGVCSMGKALCLWHNLLTGSILFEIDCNGNFVRNEDSKKQFRHPLVIVNDITQIVGKTAYSVKWFHDIGVGNLGKHASLLGGRGISFLCNVLSCSVDLVGDSVSLAESLKQSNTSTRRFEVKKWILSVLCSIFNLISLPFESGTILNLSPLLALIGAVFCMFSALLNLFKSVLYDFNCVNLFTPSEFVNNLL